MTKSLCVFCGSQHGSDRRFRAAAARLGELAAGAGLKLIYGGGQVGLMGAAADAAMAAGGEVVGLIPARLLEREVRFDVVAVCPDAKGGFVCELMRDAFDPYDAG